MRWRLNSDPRLRELMRAAVSGDREAAVRLYWETRRIRGPRGYEDMPEFLLETRFGPVRVLPQGDSIRVLSPGPGHDPTPVVVNRYKLRGEEFDPTNRWMNEVELHRLGRISVMATSSAYRKFMAHFHPLLLDWIEAHPEEMRAGAIVEANNDMWRLQEEADKLRAKLDEIEAGLAEAVVREATLGGGIV